MKRMLELTCTTDISIQDVMKMTVKELQAHLTARNLDAKGLKVRTETCKIYKMTRPLTQYFLHCLEVDSRESPGCVPPGCQQHL